MKKAIIIVFAVAILGGLATATDNKKTSGLPPASVDTAQNATAPKPVSSSTPADITNTATSTSIYKDGIYNGTPSDNPYGTVQIAAVISGGRITDIKFLQMPYQEGHSQEVSSFSEPLLKQSALAKQSVHIDFISGATDTSYSFEQSLQAALDQAAQA
jgi:uncharacterized protein with FMN-binding domain